MADIISSGNVSIKDELTDNFVGVTDETPNRKRFYVNDSIFEGEITVDLSYTGNKLTTIEEYDSTTKRTTTVSYTGNKITSITESITSV